MLPDARIGMICNFSPSYTKDDPTPADLEALRMNDGLTNRWWLDLVTKGKLPEDVIKTLTEDLGIVLPVRPYDGAVLSEGVVDWIGCNYYQPSRFQAPSKSHDEWGNPLFAEPYIWPERVMNESRGWEIYPKGIYDFGMKCKKEYPELEWYVSENGIGIECEYLNKDPETQQVIDDYRVDFVRQHLEWIARHRRRCQVRGLPLLGPHRQLVLVQRLQEPLRLCRGRPHGELRAQAQEVSGVAQGGCDHARGGLAAGV